LKNKKNEKFAKVLCSQSAEKRNPIALRIRLDCGASIEVSEDFDEKLLAKILKSAKESC
jgi:hypothetical protein